MTNRFLLPTLLVVFTSCNRPDAPSLEGRWVVASVEMWNEQAGQRLSPNEMLEGLMMANIGQVVYEFRADGTFQKTRGGNPEVAGSYEITGNDLRLVGHADPADPEAADGRTYLRTVELLQADSLVLLTRAVQGNEADLLTRYGFRRVPQ